MRLEHFRYVIAIAETNSISKAARDLYVAQPTLSVSIQNLENELGFKIFERSHRGMTLTARGQEFYRIALRIQEDLNRIDHLAEDVSMKSELNLAAVPVYCSAAMLPLLESLHRDFPEITLNIQEQNRTDVMNSLMGHHVELAVGMMVDEEETQLSRDAAQLDIVMEPLVRDQMYVYLPKKHPLSREDSIRLKDLEGEGMILLKDKSGFRPVTDRKSGSWYTFGERDSVMKAVSKGLGYAVLPGLMSLDNLYVSTELVRVIPIRDGVIATTLYLAYYRSDADSPIFRQVAERIRTSCRKIEWNLKKLPRADQSEHIRSSEIQY